MQKGFHVSFGDPLPPVQNYPNVGVVVTVQLTLTEVAFSAFVFDILETNLKEKRIVFIGSNNIANFEQKFKEFIRKYMPSLSEEISLPLLIQSIWERSQEFVKLQQNHLVNIIDVEHESLEAKKALVWNVLLAAQGYQGRAFTAKQYELMYNAAIEMSKKGAELSRSKPSNTV